MVYDADTTAYNAEHDAYNDPGYCLQQCRVWAGIDALYGDAATAWRNTNDRHPGDRNPPRGSMVYWTGGSHGYGHIAVSLGGGKVRSTDAGGSGRVATVGIDWPTQHWGLPYAGWAWDVNEVTIPHGDPKPKPDPDEVTDDDIEKVAHRVNLVLGDYGPDGRPRDPADPDPSQGNARIRRIESLARDVQGRL